MRESSERSGPDLKDPPSSSLLVYSAGSCGNIIAEPKPKTTALPYSDARQLSPG